jgi:nucleosome binding factor SPN SPT16 subunit
MLHVHTLLLLLSQVSKVALRNQQELEFDIPYLELGFYGTPFKEMVFVQPTTYALLNVTDQVRNCVLYVILLLLHMHYLMYLLCAYV